MSEQQLRRVLHEAAARVEVPPGLFPRERLQADGDATGRLLTRLLPAIRRPVARWLTSTRQPRVSRLSASTPAVSRRRWPLTVAAVVAIVLTLMGFTPLGRAAVQKLGAVFMAFRVQEMDPTEWERIMSLAPEAPEGWKPIEPGETRTYPQPPETFRRPNIAQGFTVRTLQEYYADRPWPLPTYLPPLPEQKADVWEQYDVYEEPEAALLTLTYDSLLKGKVHRIVLRLWRPLRFYDGFSQFPDERTIEVPPGALQSVQAVEVKGITATAYKEGDFWTIAWYPPAIERTKWRATSIVSSNLPLDELIKVVESLPSWD